MTCLSPMSFLVNLIDYIFNYILNLINYILNLINHIFNFITYLILYPPSYLRPTNFLLHLSTFLWTTTYILYLYHFLTSTSHTSALIFQTSCFLPSHTTAFAPHHASALPFASLILHLSWKITYTLIYPGNRSQEWSVPWHSVPWLGAGGVLVGLMGWYAGSEWWRQGSWGDIVGRSMGLVVVMMGVVAGLVGQEVFARWLVRGRSRGEVCFWSGYVCQVWLSWESVLVVWGRGSVRGCSMGIWWCRFLGSLCVTAVCGWKYWHHPARYAWIGTPLAMSLFVATVIGDLIYPFVFYHVSRIETGAPIRPHDPILYLSELLVDLRIRVWSFIESHPSDIVGVFVVAVTWCILIAILWRLDKVFKLVEAQGLRKPWKPDEAQKAGNEPLGTWAERDVDFDELKEGLNQTIVRHPEKPRIIDVSRSARVDVKVDDRAFAV